MPKHLTRCAKGLFLLEPSYRSPRRHLNETFHFVPALQKTELKGTLVLFWLRIGRDNFWRNPMLVRSRTLLDCFWSMRRCPL